MAAATPTHRRSDFGAADLILADSRLAFLVLNEVRYRVMGRVFGVSREQANLLTFVIALTGTHVALTTAERVVKAPFRVSGMDVAIGGFALREAAVGVAGPNASEVSPFATLMLIAVAGGIALPGLRRATNAVRQAERRVRTLRERQYASARRAMERAVNRP